MLPGETLAESLTYLARLTAANELDPHVTWRAPWSKLDEALAALARREIAGKAVLTL